MTDTPLTGGGGFMERRLTSETDNNVSDSTRQDSVGEVGLDSRLSLRYVQVRRGH